MFKPGRVQKLAICKLEDRGALLQAGDEEALLPKRELPEGAAVGDCCEVFVYRDGELLIATRKLPQAQVGDFALLKVSEVNPVGAFLEWGLAKQLLVPYSEQPERMVEGRSYLVKVCLDEYGRLIATARIDRCLDPDPAPYREGDEVAMLLWRFTQLGAVMIVEQRFEAVLYRDEVQVDFRVGDRFSGRVAKVREDGKLDVTLRRRAKDEIDAAQQALREALEKAGGFLPLHDKSEPGTIKQQLGMSKKLFKKALGGLYRRGDVALEDAGVRLLKR